MIDRPKISAEEMERRREIVYSGIRTNALAGARHSPEIDPILEAFVAGEIEATEIISRIREVWKAQHSPDAKALPKLSTEVKAAPGPSGSEGYTAANLAVLKGLEPVRRRSSLLISDSEDESR